MAWLWNRDKSKNQNQLEDHSGSDKDRVPASFPKAAKSGNFCRTHTYLDGQDPVWLEAFQTSDRAGDWKIIRVKIQEDISDSNKKIENRSKEKEGLSFYKMLKELNGFEALRAVAYDEVQEDENSPDQPFAYYRKFALCEGVILDQDGEPHFAKGKAASVSSKAPA
jgi:hypothetical protein